MNPRRHLLAARAPAVFSAWVAGRADDLHPADRAEADAFWTWLGELDCLVEAPATVPRRWTTRWTAIAAVIALVAVGIGAWIAGRPASPTFDRSIVAANGERRVVRLADGSIVTLAAGSRVDIKYAPDERRLWLRRGEALFEVAHNKARPFIVQTIHGEVKAVGTAFDVALGQREAAVTVVEGVIRIALPVQPGRASEPIVKLARKGERLEFGVVDNQKGLASMGFISQSDDVNVDTALAWTRGLLVFKGEPLADVVATVNRYAQPSNRLRLTDPAAASIPVFGVIDQGDTFAVRTLIDDPNAIVEGEPMAERHDRP